MSHILKYISKHKIFFYLLLWLNKLFQIDPIQVILKLRSLPNCIYWLIIWAALNCSFVLKGSFIIQIYNKKIKYVFSMASSTEHPRVEVIAANVVQAILPSYFMTMDIEKGESGNWTASSPYKSHLHVSFEIS